MVFCWLDKKKPYYFLLKEVGLIRIRLKDELFCCLYIARLAQSVEHETLNLGVVGSSPTLGGFFLVAYFSLLDIFSPRPKYELFVMNEISTNFLNNSKKFFFHQIYFGKL